MYKPEVDAEKCIGCEECVEVCPVDVYEIQEEKSEAAKLQGISRFFREILQGMVPDDFKDYLCSHFRIGLTICS